MAQLGGIVGFFQKIGLVDVDYDDDREPNSFSSTRTVRREQRGSSFEDDYRVKRPAGTKKKANTVRRTVTPNTRAVAKADNKPVARPDTMVYYISSLSECTGVIKDIIAGTSAVINFEDTDERMSQRIVDTLSGAAFALNAKVRKITGNTYLIAPKNVNVNMSRHIERRY